MHPGGTQPPDEGKERPGQFALSIGNESAVNITGDKLDHIRILPEAFFYFGSAGSTPAGISLSSRKSRGEST